MPTTRLGWLPIPPTQHDRLGLLPWTPSRGSGRIGHHKGIVFLLLLLLLFLVITVGRTSRFGRKDRRRCRSSRRRKGIHGGSATSSILRPLGLLRLEDALIGQHLVLQGLLLPSLLAPTCGAETTTADVEHPLLFVVVAVHASIGAADATTIVTAVLVASVGTVALDGPSYVALAGGMTAADQLGGLGGRELRYVFSGGAAFASDAAAGCGTGTSAAADAQLGQGRGPGSPAIGGGGEGTIGGGTEEGTGIRGAKGGAASSCTTAAAHSWLYCCAIIAAVAGA